MATVHDAVRVRDSPMETEGMTGSMEEGLAFTGMGVVGPFTIT